jgi:phospholipid transport system transporter-binding protein
MSLQLPQTLTLAEASAVLASLSMPAQQEKIWRVDASALAEFDTAALSVLLELQRRAGSLGAQIEIQQAPVKLRQLATLYGVDALLGLQPSA